MRRQVGADAIDFDTQAGRAGYSLHHPERIVYSELEDVAVSAGYTLTGIEIEIAGDVAPFECDRCTGPVSRLTAPGTGQVFEVVGALPPGPTRIKASVKDWKGAHPLLIP